MAGVEEGRQQQGGAHDCAPEVRMEAREEEAPILQLSRVSREKILTQLPYTGDPKAPGFRGLDLSLLGFRLDDAEVLEHVLDFCAALPAGNTTLRFTHNDLGSGTDCEQRVFDILAETEIRRSEKDFHIKKKRESSNQKDFAVSAGMRRKAEEGMKEADERLAVLAEELAAEEATKVATPWYMLFSRLEARSCGVIRHLDLSNCSLHATGVVLLTRALLGIEQRAVGEKVSWLALDGNALGDASMASLTAYVRMSNFIEFLQLRNVGITDQGASEIMASLVTNKSLALLDLRDNGQCSSDAGRATVSGIRRFNRSVEILLY